MMMNNFYFFTFYEQSLICIISKKNIFSDYLNELVLFIEEKVTYVEENFQKWEFSVTQRNQELFEKFLQIF
jgi:hypothetical protein